MKTQKSYKLRKVNDEMCTKCGFKPKFVPEFTHKLIDWVLTPAGSTVFLCSKCDRQCRLLILNWIAE